MIDFLRHVQREEDAARSAIMRHPSEMHAEQALDDGHLAAETEESCEMLELALATCDYEYVASNVRKLAGVFEALPCVERMSVECLTEDCPASVQERILNVLERFASEGVSSCEFVRDFAKSAMWVVTDGKRGKVIQCIFRCFGVIVSQNSEFGVEIARNVDMELIIAHLDVRAYEDDVVYFIKEITSKGLPHEMLNQLVGMLMSRDLSVGRVKACAWMILVDERTIECVDLGHFVEAAMTCEDLNDQLKLLVLSLAYENIPEFGDAFLRDIFPFLHASNKYLVATGYFAISCYLETHHNAEALMEAGFLEHVDWNQPFIAKRECTRCLCRLITTVGASARSQLVKEEIVTHLVEMIGNADKDLSLLIIGTLMSLADDPVILTFIHSSVPEVLDDADLAATMQRLMDL